MNSKLHRIIKIPYERSYQLITLVSCLILVLFLFVAGMKEWTADWRNYQREYSHILEKLAESEDQKNEAHEFSTGIRQIVLEDLGKTDRCPTCHLGTDDSRMKDRPLPFAVHSGTYLDHHPAAEYGCTVCHMGQGRAVNKVSAHARSAGIRWPQPMLAMEYTQAACGHCHLAIFEEPAHLEGTDVFRKGLAVFRQEGCLGCHKARGVGGTIGPDLTEQGKKTRHEYNFANISGEQTVTNWLYEHFKDPEMVSPGSKMLAVDLQDSDLRALITFTLGMTKPAIPYRYFSIAALNEFKGARQMLDGTDSVSMICTACHGKSGEGKSYTQYATGVPSIGNDSFLSVVSTEFIRFTVYHGRSGRQMASWLPRFSGLTEQEIDNIAVYVKARRTIRSDYNEVAESTGSIHHGKSIFLTNCAVCHGDDGKGNVIITINNPDMLAAATDKFLYDTIVYGRPNTAMPGWGEFESADVSDLIAFLRTWMTTPQKTGRFVSKNIDLKQGETTYHYLCSRCHGIYGQGETGPAIINETFLRAASDFFLSEMIARGRHGTAMFGWTTDIAQHEQMSRSDLANVIAYMRYAAAHPPDVIYPGPGFGSGNRGKMLYKKLCIDCHGTSGEGVKAPALNNQELLNAATNGYLFATVTLGRKNTPMPSWGTGSQNYPALSQQERYDLVAYLRGWQYVVIKKKLQFNPQPEPSQ